MNSCVDSFLPYVSRFIFLIFSIAPIAACVKTAWDVSDRDQGRKLKSIVQGL